MRVFWAVRVCVQFPVGASVSWELSQHEKDGFRGRCTVQGELACMEALGKRD